MKNFAIHNARKYECEIDIESAVIFLVERIKNTDNKKPVILHTMRVAMFLYGNGYGEKIVKAAILHDILEDTGTKITELENRFGKTVTTLVKANTFNESISDSVERYREMFERCHHAGKDALIIKSADILDNIDYYADNSKLYKKAKWFLNVSEDKIGQEVVWKELKEKISLKSIV